ncbi:hypothetical protein E4T39_03448 [Aureobasidium subglaciale]|nr:hypothetical protein E4T39_03448 [Aureobasidium subglaciale]
MSGRKRTEPTKNKTKADEDHQSKTPPSSSMAETRTPDVKLKTKTPSKSTKPTTLSKASGKQPVGRYNPDIDSDTEETINVAQPVVTKRKASANKSRSSNNEEEATLTPVNDDDDPPAGDSDSSVKATASIFPIKTKTSVKKGKAAVKEDKSHATPEIEPHSTRSSSAYERGRPTWITTSQALITPDIEPERMRDPFVSKYWPAPIAPKKTKAPTTAAANSTLLSDKARAKLGYRTGFAKETARPPYPEIEKSSIDDPVPTKIGPSDTRYSHFTGPTGIISRNCRMTDEDTAMTDFDGQPRVAPSNPRKLLAPCHLQCKRHTDTLQLE